MASADEIEYLKRLTPEPVWSLYTDPELSDMIDEHGVRGAARRLWEQRVTQTSGFMDITEGSSSRKLSQVHANAKRMVNTFTEDDGVKGARIHKIVRGEE